MPTSWRVYLADQRGQRKLVGVLSDRALTLRAARSRGLSMAEEEARERIRLKVRQEQRKAEKLAREEQEKAENETLDLLEKVGGSDIDIQVSGPNEKDEESADDESDSEWEYEDGETEVKSSTGYHNTEN